MNEEYNAPAVMHLKSRGLLAMIDVGATRKANATLAPPDCSCPGCQNYRVASRCAHAGFRTFLESLGLDVSTPSELDAGFVLEHAPIVYMYSGFFHLVGRLHRVEDRQEEAGKAVDLDAMNFPENTSVALAEHVYLVETAFPATVVQLEFAFALPWMHPETFTE